MRQQVIDLVDLGALPAQDGPELTEEWLDTFADLLDSISKPVTDEEAIALVRLFGPDDCYGVAWTLLHLIETAPGWPIEEALKGRDNEWIDRLKRRVENRRDRGKT